MLRKKILGLTLACTFAAPALAGGSASVEVRAQVPVACSATIVTSTQITSDPLLIHANVQRNCNATHTLTVTYKPLNPSNPASLVMTLGGNPPTSGAPGAKAFRNLPSSNTTTLLTIVYAGPPAERTEIANSFAIQISVP